MSYPIIIGMVRLVPNIYLHNLSPIILDSGLIINSYIPKIYNIAQLKPKLFLANLVPRIISTEEE